MYIVSLCPGVTRAVRLKKKSSVSVHVQSMEYLSDGKNKGHLDFHLLFWIDMWCFVMQVRVQSLLMSRILNIAIIVLEVELSKSGSVKSEICVISVCALYSLFY